MRKAFLPIGAIALFVIVLFNPNKYQTESSDSSSTKKELIAEKLFGAESQHSKQVEENKFDEPNKFAELHRMFKVRDGEKEPEFKPNYLMSEFNKAKIQKSKYTSSTTQLDWIERGPANVGGRTRGIVVDPDDPSGDTWFVGSVGGGVWKTTNAGDDWIPLTEDLPALSTVAIEMALSNTDVIYVGTGEGFYNADAVIGQGLFKTTDKGETWEQLQATANSDFYYVNRIVVDPADENVLLAATNEGIFKSTDGGASFSEKHSTSSRTQHLIANPHNFNTLYCAEESRGVLKSTDGGESWSLKNISGGGRFEISIAPSDTNRLYAANETSILYVSLDAGETWSELEEESGSTPSWLGGQGWYDNTIEVHPFDEDVVFAGGIDLWRFDVTVDEVLGITSVTTSGDFDSVFVASDQKLDHFDGGVGVGNEFWGESVFDTETLVEIELRSGAGIGQNAHRFSTNTYDYEDYVEIPFEVWDITNNRQLAVSFEDIDNNDMFNLRITRGDIIFIHDEEYDPNNHNTIIAQTDGAKYENMYVIALKSQLGTTWDPDNLPETTLAILNGQVEVAFKNSQPITDGYNQYGSVPAGVHVDQHNLVMIPINETTGEFRIVNGNDGGVGISNDGGDTWRETDAAGYNTTQFYGFDKKNGSNEYLGGTQDNGTWQSKPGEDASKTTEYYYRLGGDGFEVSWHHDDPLKMMGGSQYNNLYRTTDGWQTSQAASNGFDDWGNSTNSPFISKIAESNSDPDLVFTISRQGVYRSDNYAENWTLSPIPSNDFHSGGYFSFANIEISIADPQIVWAGAYMSGSGSIHVSKDGGLTFQKTTNSKQIGLASGISTHPTDPATAYACFGVFGQPKIMRTTNYGDSWHDITGFSSGSTSSNGFPDVTVYDVAVMPYDTEIIWAGTELGIFESVDGGDSWYYADNGLPAVAVWDMRIVNDQVVVGTHGRGIWSVTLPELADYEAPVVTKSPRLNSIIPNFTGMAAYVDLRSPYDSTIIYVDGEPFTKIGASEVSSRLINFSTSVDGEINVYAASFKDGREYKSATVTAVSTSILDPQNGYINNFSSSVEDFFIDGALGIETPIGFTNKSLHSPHPYDDMTESVALLRVPIIVAETDAIFSYDDVAIIEPGDPGTEYGDQEFWDYVVVEGFNGADWIPLGDGYDARYNSSWLNAYNGNINGDASMFVTHNIDLHNYYNAGDTILVRFRMYTDEFVTGWGWAIDNIDIQGELVGVEDENAMPITFTLDQNYPNPFNPSTTISYSIPKQSKVTLEIYSITGELVETLINDVKAAGNYKVEWSPQVASGVYFYKIAAGDFVQTKKMILLK